VTVMSLESLTYVFDWSPTTGVQRLVMIALADSANENGIVLAPDVDSIARIANVTPEEAVTTLRDMARQGYLHRPETPVPAGFPDAVQITGLESGYPA
jgi:hypothetical protein